MFMTKDQRIALPEDDDSCESQPFIQKEKDDSPFVQVVTLQERERPKALVKWATKGLKALAILILAYLSLQGLLSTINYGDRCFPHRPHHPRRPPFHHPPHHRPPFPGHDPEGPNRPRPFPPHRFPPPPPPKVLECVKLAPPGESFNMTLPLEDERSRIFVHPSLSGASLRIVRDGPVGEDGCGRGPGRDHHRLPNGPSPPGPPGFPHGQPHGPPPPSPPPPPPSRGRSGEPGFPRGRPPQLPRSGPRGEDPMDPKGGRYHRLQTPEKPGSHDKDPEKPPRFSMALVEFTVPKADAGGQREGEVSSSSSTQDLYACSLRGGGAGAPGWKRDEATGFGVFQAKHVPKRLGGELVEEGAGRIGWNRERSARVRYGEEDEGKDEDEDDFEKIVGGIKVEIHLPSGYPRSVTNLGPVFHI
ncbi:hypothetical protein IE53DRAFT_380060 [Violaceomyces palustris]|uniref:Uncharacterized protein n=1 Tax=Violaceomyces palustris TaxID=1673888 RepID=A0ACD0NW21_9BASI|nr:hypothetical protein IE53DRAFT_380060 [Violaceomyces palustris]